MFTGFNLKTDKTFRKHKSSLENLVKKHEAQIHHQLEHFLLPDGESLDGTDIQNAWFPGVEANVFISHSHDDKDIAMGLAGRLWDRFQLISFIDSCVWGYANNLLKKIDNEYCKNKGESTYDYNLRNYSTSHVHMMLSNALTKMIDKTECIIFLNSPKSISTDDVMKNKTRSPWIYHEIAMTRLIRRRSIAEHRKELQKSLTAQKYTEDKQLPHFYYDLDLSHLRDLTDEELDRWNTVKYHENGVEYLDRLYELKGLPQLPLTESH